MIEYSFDHFVPKAKSKMVATAAGLKKFTDAAQAPPGLLQDSEDERYVAVAKRYSDIVREMAADRAKSAASKSKADKVLGMSEEEIFTKRVREFSREVAGVKSKNGGIPGAAPGHNPTYMQYGNRPKGKGKGKG